VPGGVRATTAMHAGICFGFASLGNLSNHDGNAKENVTLKMTSKHLKLFRDSFNWFNLSYVAE